MASTFTEEPEGGRLTHALWPRLRAGPNMHGTDCEDVVAEFIRIRGITRCPTACVSPTQGSVGLADRAALEEHAVARDRLRRTKIAARARSLWTPGLPN